MSYRIEATEMPGEYVREENGPTDIGMTLRCIGDAINEAYSAVCAIMRFLYAEDPTKDATRNASAPTCFAAELTDTKVRAGELADLTTVLAKRMGA